MHINVRWLAEHTAKCIESQQFSAVQIFALKSRKTYITEIFTCFARLVGGISLCKSAGVRK